VKYVYKLTVLAAFALSLSFVSCGGGKKNDPAPTAASGVYVAGWEADSGANYAALWKDGNGQRLPIGHGAYRYGANSVFVSGNDVYVAGWEEYRSSIGVITTITHAVLWKNGVYQRLSDDNNSQASSVFVSGSDVYVGGCEYELTGPTTGDISATIWKNGVPQHLDGLIVRSVYVSDGDVYAVGLYEEGVVNGSSDNRAVLWKNGVRQRLSESDSIPSSFYVSGTDVYVAGYDTVSGKQVATVWKNGVPQRLSQNDSTLAWSVFVVK